jgi:hypothetical protein
MANELFCYEQAAPEADERGAVPALWAKLFADTVGEATGTGVRYRKFREPTLDGKRSPGSKTSAKSPEGQLAPAPVQDGKLPPVTMSGYDFYRAACVEAHARLLDLP